MFPGLELYYANPAQPLTTAGEELDYLDHDLSDLSVRSRSWSICPRWELFIKPHFIFSQGAVFGE